MRYLGPVFDPLFSATGANNFTLGDTTVYAADNFFNVLSCIEQSQYCNPNNGRCTGLASPLAAESLADDLDLNDDQRLLVARFSRLMLFSTTWLNGIGTLGVAGRCL
jgi:hypothetical protein